jgi:S-(hydroxymethyl)glutathione dehydrogenase/alcohol dehydrogenase
VLEGTGARLELRDVEVLPPGPGEVRVRVAACGVCHSDLSVATGTLRSPVPVVLGHEVAGVVVETGREVTSPGVGQPVIVALSPACGTCAFCREGMPNLCVQMVPGMIGSTALDGTTRLRHAGRPVYQLCGVGGFAEEVVVAAAMCVPVPPGVPLERACLLGCGVLTGAGAVLNTAAVTPGRSVAVIGCGGVGLAAVQAARIAGADPVVAVDVEPAKLALARALGATHAVVAGGDVVADVRAICPFGVHVAVEAAGRTDTLECAWEMLRPGGTAVAVGMPAARDRVSLRMGGFFQARRIVGCVYGGGDPHRDIPRLLDLVRSGRFQLDPLVAAELPLARAQDALDALSAGRGPRHVLVMTGGEP